MGVLVACLKHVALRVRVDPLTGAVSEEPHATGMSEADAAALEWALRLGKLWQREVVAVTAGPPESESVLRTAVAAGAARAVRAGLPADAASESVADALAGAVPTAELYLCGDHSLDRGSGSVPAFLAARTGAAQALGLVTLAAESNGVVTAERRLDGGRRERLRLRTPAVLSVESASARLRRAALTSVVAARTAQVTAIAAPTGVRREATGHIGPYRPRARALPGPDPSLPARERILALTGALTDRTPPRLVTAEPEEAADELLRYLHDTGYLR